MKRVHRKIVSGALLCGCALFTLYGASRVAEKSEKGALPVSLSGEGDELPVIVLDAGHGGIDGGCTSAEGVPEKGINLDILLRLRDILEVNGYEVRVTRDSDRSIHDEGVEGIAAQKSSDMDNRLAMFNESGNAVCVSVHQNQFTDPKYKGAQMFYSGSNSTSEVLARALQSRFRELLQPDNDREIKLCGKELFLCYYSDNPTVMAECGFMSNPDEAALLNTEEYRGKVAFTLFAGINDFVHRKK
ncbi:N-acetylmuramoyl-L-alanine amidase [Ruminococcus flavefaciens]|uniref:N-acetylmuramoyl-L-alanine amidase n=1 Tax=Ruminococcus flavefaciens TaxID=1265 RepID=A0A315XWD0_RUMFL|nr:N-acetylmuramoyl-L-alanine amidase [Ruminococcus flavefaciens]PWJ11578.1 N-acetylmuramoyl-L-alanine amidase [Ruminococcus flavefaciens]SSA50487.1 N-acetylmuramoyl-L-alanine amidase [Ruminococcus flavefaciens]